MAYAVEKILILRLRNLSKQCLLRFLCLNIKIFYLVCFEAFQGLQDKTGHAEFLSSSTCIFCVPVLELPPPVSVG